MGEGFLEVPQTDFLEERAQEQKEAHDGGQGQDGQGDGQDDGCCLEDSFWA